MIIHFLLSFLITVFQITPLPSAGKTIAMRQMSLEKRYADRFVNNVFKDNILLTIKYTTGQKIDISRPFATKLELKPDETFAFHDDVLSQYEGKVSKTTNAHFSLAEGFKSDGYLVGDGVCHLASLLYWVAKEAGLKVLAPTRHDFAPVPEVPREFGVSIYANPEKSISDQLQNLYISNTKSKTIAFVFNYDGERLMIKAVN